MGNKPSIEENAIAVLKQKSKREQNTRYDTQIIHNHGKVSAETAVNDGGGLIASVPSMDESKLMSDASMAIAQKNFVESLKAVQRDEQPLVALSRATHFDVPTLRGLRTVFNAISSQDKEDDLISFQELCKATGTKPESLLGWALFRLLDITRSNQINFRAWVIMLSHLSPEASMDEKINFAFNLYDDNGDGFIDEQGLKKMLLSATESTIGLSDREAATLISKAFEQADHDKDKRINLADYRHLVTGSQNFFDAFTVNVENILAQYNVISPDEIQARVEKLRVRDARHDEKLNAPAQQAKDQAFMEKEEDDLRVIDDVDALDV